MTEIKSFLVQPVSRSLIPFLAGSTCYALKGLWLNNSQRVNLQAFLGFIHEICFGIYNNFFAFLFMMLLIDFVFRAIQRATKKAKASSDLILEFPEKDSPKLFNLFSENQVIRILSYIMIFAVVQIAGLCLNFAQSEVSNIHSSTVTIEDSQDTQMLSEMIMMKNINQGEGHFGLHPSRILEEVDGKTTPIPALPKSSDKISLSMGNVMSSLNLVVTAMTLSKDKKTVFATLDFYGTIKIIDISDLQNPVIVGSLGLKVPGYYYRIKSLHLSYDEKTLYVSNSRDLEIIDVSDLGSPKLISYTPSTLFEEDYSFEISRFYQTSLALDEKTMTLFIGGIGLQIYDVLDPRTPALLKAEKNNLEEIGLGRTYSPITRNELCLSHDGKYLFIANGTLDVYDISNPTEMKLVTSLKTKSSPRSIFLQQDSKIALILGTSANGFKIILEEVDISDPVSPVIVKTYNLNEKSTFSPRILAVSPSKSKVYIFADEDYLGYDLLIFDLIKKTAFKNQKSLIEKVQTMAFSPDGKTLITGSNDQLMIVELFLEYPNKQIWSGTPLDVISEFPRPSEITQMKSSPDGNTLYLLQSTRKEGSSERMSTFEIVNMSNYNEPKVLGSYESPKMIYQMYFSHSFNTVFLTQEDHEMLVLDISKKSSPALKMTYTQKSVREGFMEVRTSSDEKTGFVTRYDFDKVYLTFFDLSETSEIKGFFTLDKAFTTYNCRIEPVNDKTLLILDKELLIYDISDVKAPKLASSLPLGINEPEPYISSYLLSPDKKTLFVETYDQNEFRKLRIYNISETKSPKMISEKEFSKFSSEDYKPAFTLSPDMKTGYVFQDSSLVKVNLTDLKDPKISGIITLPNKGRDALRTYALSRDGQRIYAAFGKNLTVLNMNIKYSLYLKQEKFLLGEKYSDNVAMLNLSDIADYDMMETSAYRVIRLALMDIKVAPNKYSLDMTASVLPSWITFDRMTNVLTVEPKKQRELGTYTFYSAVSLKIPSNIFDDLGTTEKPVNAEDLLAWLISLDYVDNQLYLTGNFGALDAFYLPAQFSDYKKEIYNTLKKFFVETSTIFEVVPSLQLKTVEDNLLISSLSASSIKVEIRLEPRSGSEAKFLYKPYASLLPAIKDASKTQVSLEGFIKDINPAMQSIVVNFEHGSSCDATITIIDGLNPAITVSVKNISRYFKLNQAPVENLQSGKTVQTQIDQASIETGKYFAFSWAEETFTDEYSESLSYEIVAAKNGTAVPTWLSLSGLTLKGTPPEEITGRDVDLILVARNEFKHFGVPFKLQVRVSPTFVLKLMLRYSPYILTFLGLLVSANKILNIVGKKSYKHPKEFFVSVDEEVSPSVIFPIAFIQEENKQSQLIFKEMLTKIPKGELSSYFVNPMSNVLDKQKIRDAIQEAIRDMPSHYRETINAVVDSDSVINQIIINRFVYLQLQSKGEVKTKLLFDELEHDCLEAVERGSAPSGEFTINSDKLNNLMKRIPGNNLLSGDPNESLLSGSEGVNVSLLKDAILAHAFETHSLDISPVNVDISVKQAVKSSSLFKFLKLDLKDIFLNEKNKIDYGINYKIFDDKLCFYGVAQKHFRGRKLAVQIMTLRHKILKEVWIHGVSSEFQKDEAYLMKDEREARGLAYERL